MGWGTTRYKRKGGAHVIDHNQTINQSINREKTKTTLINKLTQFTTTSTTSKTRKMQAVFPNAHQSHSTRVKVLALKRHLHACQKTNKQKTKVN